MYRLLVMTLIAVIIGGIVSAQEGEATAEASAPPAPYVTVEEDGMALDLYFDGLRQGRAGLIALRGANISHAEASVFNQRFEFFAMPDDADTHYALIVARMEQPIRTYDLTISVDLDEVDDPVILTTPFNVLNGGFIQQTVILPPEDELLELLDPQVEADELAFLFETAAPENDVPLWDSGVGFIPPLSSELTSPFGAVRVFNEDYNSVHTGWDFRAEIGQPMVASSSGQVAFAGELPLRGNYVLIHHGRGVYSGYAHLSLSYVTQGQHVATGQVVGLVGSTGRSSSAHAHIEFIVAGEWVDAADFIRMWLP